MKAKRTATLVAGLLIAHSFGLIAEESDLLLRLGRTLAGIAPSGVVEVDQHDPARAICTVAGGRVELLLGVDNTLEISSRVGRSAPLTPALLRRISDINDRLDVGTLGWNRQGEIVLIHRIADASRDLEGTAEIVVRMAILSDEIVGMIRSIARS